MEAIAPDEAAAESAPQPDFFISRAGADAAFAEQLGRILEGAGYRVILQQWDFANRNFMERMHAALESGARVIALLSREYFESEHCVAEALNAIGHDPLNKKARLIVMRVGKCTPGGLFTALAYWDLLPLRDNAAMLSDVVLGAVDKKRRKTAADVAAPYWRPARTVLHDRIRAVPNFTGRREDLAALDKVLWTDGGAGGHVVAITQAAVQGLGGVGKSTLAIQYAFENRERYAGVWRLGADSQAGIVDGLVALGATFIPGLAEVENRAEAASAALRFITEAGFEKPWLLIYDNVEQPKALDGLTPRAGAQVLVTTRWPDWKGRAAGLTLGVFAPEEAAQFLLGRTGRTDAEGAAQLGRDLGYLPLALDHAAAFCVETGDSFADYAARLPDWIAQAPESADYPRAVFATFSLAIEQAAVKCPEAETLMGILAFLAPDDIPRDVIPEYIIDAMALRQAIAALNKVSLLKIKGHTEGTPLLSVHRLVQMVMRKRLETENRAEEVSAFAALCVCAAFPRDEVFYNVASWPICEKLVSHATTVLKVAPRFPEAAKVCASLSNQVGMYLYSRADYTQAEQLLRLALTVGEKAFGSNHVNISIALNNLSSLLIDTGRLDEASELLVRAHLIAKTTFPPESLEITTIINNHAQILQSTGRLDEAEPLMREALRADEVSFGPEHPKVATRLNNLAMLLREKGKPNEAEGLIRRALAIDEKQLGCEHPNTASDLSNLALVLQETDRKSEAEHLMRQALRINEATYGPNHPSVALCLGNLAGLLFATGRRPEAEQLMRRSLTINEGAYGRTHESVARNLNNLAQLLQDTNRLAEAEPLARRAVEICATSLGWDHPNTQTAAGNHLGILAALKGVDVETLVKEMQGRSEGS